MGEAAAADATFAFVDLSGFTALTEMCGDEEAALLAGRLVDLARDSLTVHVSLVKKSMGDAVMLRAPPGPEQMMATIVALADRAAAEDGFLVLRVGIHHGSAVERDNDFFGHAVNTAARVTALAGAGQAIVTDPILPACEGLGLAVRSLGATALRNIASPMAVYRVSLPPPPRYPVDPPCVGFELIRAQPATMCGTTIKTYGSAPADAPNGSWPLMKANNLKEGEPAAPTTTTDPGARRVEPPLSFEGCLHAAGFQRPPDPLVGSLGGLPQQLFGLRLGSEAYRWRKHQRGGQEWSEQGRARRHSEVKAGANPVRRK